ncbi:MAG: glucosidase [Acidobacteria bacterium]|nr:MAG: glucosidase [Acidobacteriota bacterium]REJ98410.1 MAG: glucosidase [Acidobacteriota bacterium]REK17156.1 MAG: glucosidase [Acidobacteriota bacterium]REK43066.1 MAG: glucosidase [Acidobacteriota bacterium]
MNAEEKRLEETRQGKKNWRRWGPYLSERAWGTVREDYSEDGSAWDHFPHDHARSRAFRWNEDGLGGISDDGQNLCFSVALWNERDPILKERLFGLTGTEGNHGEDVKELYYYLDSTPTHSYMKFLYKYPQGEFPYEDLLRVNRERGKREREYELLDTGVFDEDRYFDVYVEYAKASENDLLVRITAENRGPEAAALRILPTVWFRNTWSWNGSGSKRPELSLSDVGTVSIESDTVEGMTLYFKEADEILFTDNETNKRRIWGLEDGNFAKDGINDYIVSANKSAVNGMNRGTKAAGHYKLELEPGGSKTVKLRFSAGNLKQPFGRDFDVTFENRRSEADEFYNGLQETSLGSDARHVQRQAFAGMLWSKQFYHYDVDLWLKGDPGQPSPPESRKKGRNAEWRHLNNADIISMPDKWEYPWYAAWDLAFHCIPLAMVDPDFAKEQLVLMLREWYMHPNGQIPAYEWAYGDVNPPVHAWAALRVYQIDKKKCGKGDVKFLARVFQKLLLNFTWWVNRKDSEGMNVFEGGFLGLDNIGVFDRSQALPTGGKLAQSDGTSWMAMYCLNMLAIALELAATDDTYEDVATKFWEHFLYIAAAMNDLGHEGIALWNEEDGFYYDVLHLHGKGSHPLKVRSMVGLIPLFAVATIEPESLAALPDFRSHLQWFIENRPELTAHVACMNTPGEGERRLLAVAFRERLERVLKVMLDENEFLSPHGIRAVSRFHLENPYVLNVNGSEHRVDYEPGESSSGLFGGNSNWRGPIWFPVNYLIIESLQKFHWYFGDDLKVECPTGSGNKMNLWEVSQEISRRLSHIFLLDDNGRRPVWGSNEKLQNDPEFRDHVLFYEYFHGDNGSGIGASHQTGWTGLVAKLLQQSGE